MAIPPQCLLLLQLKSDFYFFRDKDHRKKSKYVLSAAITKLNYIRYILSGTRMT
jgi:hypothetical protein